MQKFFNCYIDAIVLKIYYRLYFLKVTLLIIHNKFLIYRYQKLKAKILGEIDFSPP
jgi:hypothetical protein